jgi:putative transposase
MWCPVRARLVERVEDWPWSSARAHVAGRDDGPVRVAPLIARIGRFADRIETQSDCASFASLRSAGGAGRPIGSAGFVADQSRPPSSAMRSCQTERFCFCSLSRNCAANSPPSLRE